MNSYGLVCLFCCLYTVQCRDFYVGMFKKDDILVVSDSVYKARVPFRHSCAKYGRVLKCPITYFRVVDRLGIGRGPEVQILRGGLLQKYLVLQITSYNLPISVNVYIGCENKMSKATKLTKTTNEKQITNSNNEENNKEETKDPSSEPTGKPSQEPDKESSTVPNKESSKEPSEKPNEDLTKKPNENPTENLTEKPAGEPNNEPTKEPNKEPTEEPKEEPNEEPSK